MRWILALALIGLNIGCSRQIPSQLESPSSATFVQLSNELPVDRKRAILKKCFVDGVDLTNPTSTLRKSAGSSVDISGQIAPGEMGISGIVPNWVRRKGEPNEPISQTLDVNHPKFTFMLNVFESDISKNPKAVYLNMVESRQLGEETEFRLRFDAPKTSGRYVIDLRLVRYGAGNSQTDGGPTSIFLPIWRCEMVVN
mgnify:CR=1 FL=1